MRYGTTSSPGMAKDLSYFFRQNDRDDDAPRQISFHIIDSYNTSEEEIASFICLTLYRFSIEYHSSSFSIEMETRFRVETKKSKFISNLIRNYVCTIRWRIRVTGGPWKSLFGEKHETIPEVCGSQGYSCIFAGSLCFTSQLCIVQHCWSFMYRVLDSLERFGLTSRCLFSRIRKERSSCNAVRIILLLVGLAFQDYKDFFIFLPLPTSLSLSLPPPSLRPPFQFSFRVIDVPPDRIPNTPSLTSVLEDNTRNEFYSSLSLHLWMHPRFDDSLNIEGYERRIGCSVSGKSGSAHTRIGRFVNEPLVKPAAVFKFRSFPYFLFFFFFSSSSFRLRKRFAANDSQPALPSTSIVLPFI